MQVIIRQAKKTDLNQLMKLESEYSAYVEQFYFFCKPFAEIKSALRKFRLKQMESKNFLFLVAECNKQVIGFFIVGIKKNNSFFKDKKAGFIFDAFVQSKYRKKGLTKKMFNESLIWFKKQRINYIGLNVSPKNKFGLNAWQKLGFEEINQYRVFRL